MKAQSQSRDLGSACRLAGLCFRDAKPYEQEGRQAGLGIRFRIAGVQGTKQSVGFHRWQSQSRDLGSACRPAGLCFRDAKPYEQEGRQGRVE